LPPGWAFWTSSRWSFCWPRHPLSSDRPKLLPRPEGCFEISAGCGRRATGRSTTLNLVHSGLPRPRRGPEKCPGWSRASRMKSEDAKLTGSGKTHHGGPCRNDRIGIAADRPRTNVSASNRDAVGSMPLDAEQSRCRRWPAAVAGLPSPVTSELQARFGREAPLQIPRKSSSREFAPTAQKDSARLPPMQPNQANFEKVIKALFLQKALCWMTCPALRKFRSFSRQVWEL